MSGRGGDPAWVVWLSLAGLIAVIAGGVFAAVYAARSGAMAGFDAAEADARPEAGKVGKTIQAKFPDEFAKLEKRLASLRDGGAELSEIRDDFASFAVDARTRHVEEAAQAPHEALAALRKAELDAFELLERVWPEECGYYVVTGAPGGGIADAASHRLETEAHNAFWEAAAAGRDRPAKREVAMVDREDMEAFEAALRTDGIAEADLPLINRPETMPADKQCEIGLRRLRALDQLPPDAADRIYASVMLGNI